MNLTDNDRLAEILRHFGLVDGDGMIGELYYTVLNLLEGGQDLQAALFNAAQEMRDTLSKIQDVKP